ncbi:MAG: hypothetical protein FWG29_05330 [Treponema sp.]|nr:hypothetical protein [Treponema sp.]
MGKNKAVYAPGELSKTRDRLKIEHLDLDEAKRMTKLLGGEVGYERSEDQEATRNKQKVRNEVVEVNIGGRGKRGRRIDLASGDDELDNMDWKEYRKKKKKEKEGDPSDDPSASLTSNYWERVKMDKFCGQGEFEIKSPGQVLISMLSILSEPPDNVNPAFVTRRINEYYKRIETLVTSVRTLLPRNNMKRNEKLKKASPFDFAILDTFRYWNIDSISSNLSRIQTRPRNVKTVDFTEIVREIYKPMYILEQLNTETHIKGAFKLLYKVLFLENPTEAKGKYQELIRTALSSYSTITRDIRYQLYPLLMKLVSNCWIPYETFFHERKNRIRAFLQVTEKNRISPQMENAATAEEVAEIAEETEEAKTAEEHPETKEIFDESNMDEPLTEEERQKKQVHESKAKAREKGLSALETLFPKAGWDRIHLFPDLYPYFSDVFSLKKGVELIAPTDPLQQVYIFSIILEELFFGLRYTEFGVIMGSDGNPERLDDSMNRIINGWQRKIESSFEKEYLPRLAEYCGLLENTAESRTSNYAKRLLNELQWAKRLYFLPYYKFESIMPPPFQKNTTDSLYPEVRSLRRYLTAIAAGIEQSNKRGGADNRAPCDGIDNPWDPYVFQVPNPVSKRLDQLLAPKKRNNASLIFFTLAITVVLDQLLNDEDSWAYGDRSGVLFRSEKGEGVRPTFSVDDKVDTEQLFKQELKKRQIVAAQAEAKKKASELNV